MDDPNEPAWWYRRDQAEPGADDPVRAAGTGAPSLPTPNRDRSVRPEAGDLPHPGLAAPGRHGWARSEGTYIPSVTDRGANKAIILGVIGLLFCAIVFGPAAIVEGVKARRRIAASGGGLTGNARAIVGICLGGLATFLAALGVLALVVQALSI